MDTSQSEPAVYVRLVGGLGNQMFQYAAGRAAAHRYNCPLKLDISWYQNQEKRQYLLDKWLLNVQIAGQKELAPFARQGLEERLKPRFGRYFLPFKQWKVYKQPGQHFDDNFLQMTPPVLLQGYFQSELYFRSVFSHLRTEFKPRDPLSASSQHVLHQIKSTEYPVALHVRRGDYINHAKTQEVHGTCSADYYQLAGRIIENLSRKSAHYFIFSDEPQNVVDDLQGYDLKRLTIVAENNNRPWEDMYLMAACQNNIIANSSFSWWGAWLNARPNKIVIAPRRWFQRDIMLQSPVVDLIPDGWVTL